MSNSQNIPVISQYIHQHSSALPRAVFAVVFFSCAVLISDAQPRLRLIYSGNEQGQLEMHGCDEQVGGLDRRHTVIQSLRAEHPNSLNLHVGNILGTPDANSELVYQIALEALGLMDYDVMAVEPKTLGNI